MNQWKNQLYYGDNLQILREYIPDQSIDLIYLDPPFNSNRNYNVLFKEENSTDSEAQITAFEDTWHWDQKASEIYRELITDTPEQISGMIGALKDFIGENQMMAYLVMMTARLIELHLVLKPTGSLYLHCDPTASHYLKIVLDAVFGGQYFRNEIIWHYRKWSVRQQQFVRNHDIVFFYSKSDSNERVFNQLLMERAASTLKRFGKSKIVSGHDQKGKRLPSKTENIESEGVALDDVWDIGRVPPVKQFYPTQKPLELLERIISASSNEGDLVLDPFCGCGTTVHAAEKLGRRWIGIDITHLSTSLSKYRLKDAFDLIEGKGYDVIGEPQDTAAARQLAQEDRYQFQWWSLSLIQAKPVGGQKGSKKGEKGKDRGIDGVITLMDDPYGKPKRILVQVKSGKVGVKDIRDLVGTVEREKAAIGVFVTLGKPTRDMKREAVSAGIYHSPGWNRDYPKIQILTTEQLLNREEIQMPPVRATFKKAKREAKREEVQEKLC